jgi:hypothetical protein
MFRQSMISVDAYGRKHSRLASRATMDARVKPAYDAGFAARGAFTPC